MGLPCWPAGVKGVNDLGHAWGTVSGCLSNLSQEKVNG